MKTYRLVAILVVATIFGEAGSRAAGEEKSWAGESVLAIKPPKDIKFRDRVNGKEGYLAISGGIMDVDEATALDPKDAIGFIKRALAWLNMKEYDKAIKDFDEAILLDPNSSLAFNNRGLTWYYKKEYDKAIKDYSEAIRLNPMYALAFHKRALAWGGKKEYDKAIKDYDEAIKLDPKNSIAFYNRGLVWSGKNETDKAIKDYDDAIRLEPKFPAAFINRGNLSHIKKEYDKAIKDHDEAIRLEPNNSTAFVNRGNVWRDKKKYDKAIKDYDEAVRLDPKTPIFHFYRSVALMLMRRPEAAKGFQRFLDLDGGKGDQRPYAVILGHFAARQEGDESAAKRFLKDIDGNLNEAWPHPIVKFLRGEIDEPLLLEIATEADKRAEARLFLGLDEALKGHKDKALDHFRWVKEQGDLSLIAIAVALAELDRLEEDQKKPKP